MPDIGYDVLSQDLAALGRALPDPVVDPDLVDTVMARLSDVPSPAADNPLQRLLRGLAGAVARDRRLAAVVAALLLSSLAAPPVRAAVADWFSFAGVIVHQDPTPRPSVAPPPPTVGTTTSLEKAQRLVAFDAVVPTALGSPQGVEVSADRRKLSMSWTSEADGALRLDQFDARLDYSFAKNTPGVEFTSVGAAFAIWFDEPHEVVVLNPDGTRRTETARLAGHTLIWERGDTALRLEGDISLARAVEIARSVTVLP